LGREKVIISQEKGCIFLEGQGKEITTVTSSGYHSAAMVTSKFQLNNRLGATFVSLPSNVIVIGITFEVISSIFFLMVDFFIVEDVSDFF